MTDILNLREDFPILGINVYGKPLVYLDNAATTQKPRPVLERVHDFYTGKNANAHRGTHYLGEQAGAALESARRRVKEFINARSVNEVLFTSGATESINMVADSFGETAVGQGDEIIITEMEHHSNLVPWQMLSRRRGARLKILPFDDDGCINLETLGSLLNAKTKLVAATYVSNALGVVNPVKEIIDIAHSASVPVLIDGAQAVQHLQVDVRKLGCDFFAFSGHKMYAATGIGVLYGKESLLEKMPPYKSGGGMVAGVNFNDTTFADLPFKFEAGTVNLAAAVSLEAAIDYIEAIGLDVICRHEKNLLEYAAGQLEKMDGVELYAVSAKRCGALPFNLKGVSDYDAGMILDKMGIAVRTGNHCAEPVMKHYGIGGMVRASFALYNTKEDVDRLVEGIGRVQTMMS